MIDNIWSILGFLVGLGGTIAGVVLRKPNLAKGLKVFANAIKSIPDFIRQAEKISTDPIERKTYVLNMFVLHCQAQGYAPSEEELADVSEQIDDQVKLTKDININSKNTIKPIEHVGGGTSAN